jgi:ABC-type transporter Mla subunit MlaD
MDGNSFIAQLRDIRQNLRDSIRTAAQFHNKLVGPSPEEGKIGKEAVESVSTLLSEITNQSAQLAKMLAHQHDIIGDFGPSVETAQPSRYA